jgi:hypothetical protein
VTVATTVQAVIDAIENDQVGYRGCVVMESDLDRILERGRVLTLDGPSMRTKHLGLDDPTSPGASDQQARISGIDQPDFPEPTTIVGPLKLTPLVDSELRECAFDRALVRGNLGELAVYLHREGLELQLHHDLGT